MEEVKGLCLFRQKVKEFFRSRSAGFYLLMTVVLLSLVQVIAYDVLYAQAVRSQYADATAKWLPYLAIAAALVMSGFKETERFAGLALFAVQFASFLAYISGTYMYFSTVFFGGFSLKALVDMDGAVSFCIIIFVIILILSGIAAYIKPFRTEKKEKSLKKGRVVDSVEITELREQIANIKAELDNFKTENEELKKEIADMKRVMSTAATASSEVETYDTSEMQRLETELEKLKSELGGAVAYIDGLETAKRIAEQKRLERKKSLEQAPRKPKAPTARQQIDELKKEMEEFKKLLLERGDNV